jgi:hypothetical protein
MPATEGVFAIAGSSGEACDPIAVRESRPRIRFFRRDSPFFRATWKEGSVCCVEKLETGRVIRWRFRGFVASETDGRERWDGRTRSSPKEESLVT